MNVMQVKLNKTIGCLVSSWTMVDEFLLSRWTLRDGNQMFLRTLRKQMFLKNILEINLINEKKK